MEKSSVKVVQVSAPITAVGKHFTGDYANSPQFVAEVQQLLASSGIGFAPNKVLGVYYDNPQNTPAQELKCFQGVFPESTTTKISPLLTTLILKGQYLYVKVTGPPPQSVYDGYNALFSYIQEHGIILKSSAGFQISTFEDNTFSMEMYMEII